MARQVTRRAARMRRTNYYYPHRQLERLRVESASTGLPVAELIRRAIDVVYPEVRGPKEG